MSQKCWILLVALALGLCATARAQRVSSYDSHVRVYAVVEKVGAGTSDDPYRPKYLANPRVKGGPGVKALGWAGVVSADRSRYFIEVVAARRADLAPLLNDPAVQWWDKAVTPAAQVESVLRGLQPAASLARLRVRVP